MDNKSNLKIQELLRSFTNLGNGEIRKIIEYMDGDKKENIIVYNPTSKKLNELADIIFQYSNFAENEMKANLPANITMEFIKELTNVPNKNNKEKLREFLDNSNFPVNVLVEAITDIVRDIIHITTKIISYLDTPYRELGINLIDIMDNSLDQDAK